MGCFGSALETTVRASSSFFFFQAEDGIRDYKVTGVQTCALPICFIMSRRPAGHDETYCRADDRGRYHFRGPGVVTLPSHFCTLEGAIAQATIMADARVD